MGSLEDTGAGGFVVYEVRLRALSDEIFDESYVREEALESVDRPGLVGAVFRGQRRCKRPIPSFFESDQTGVFASGFGGCNQVHGHLRLI